MKAITIHQPWASLIAHGFKRFETRGWRTHYRGPIAIHAAKKIDHQAALMVARDYPKIWREITPLPIGCIVAVAELVECWSVFELEGKLYLTDSLFGTVEDIPEFEMEVGYLEPGRFAWEMSEVERLARPILARGQQGLWNWKGKAH